MTRLGSTSHYMRPISSTALLTAAMRITQLRACAPSLAEAALPPMNVLFECGSERDPAQVTVKHFAQYEAPPYLACFVSQSSPVSSNPD